MAHIVVNKHIVQGGEKNPPIELPWVLEVQTDSQAIKINTHDIIGIMEHTMFLVILEWCCFPF